MKLAFVFPGQGSQQIGMMDDFVTDAGIRATFDEASGALGEDLWALASSGSSDAINLTRNTQPLMLTADVAIWRAWRAAGGPAPSVVAGHSLGEYAALVAAGALELKDAVPLVRFRAEAMQDAVGPGIGAMAAIMGADDAAVVEACREASRCWSRRAGRSGFPPRSGQVGSGVRRRSLRSRSRCGISLR